jgi:hypothetical protein
VLLAVDDVQWLDAASEDAIAFAARRLSDGLAARVLVARRRGDDGDGEAPLALDRALDGRVERPHDLGTTKAPPKQGFHRGGATRPS